MAVTLVISPAELERQVALAFEGKSYEVFLADSGVSGFTEESTKAQWKTVELAGNGYETSTGTIGTGSYVNGKYQLPEIEAVFQATDIYTYDTVILIVGDGLSIHSIATENPPITLLAGQSKMYRLNLFQDNA